MGDPDLVLACAFNFPGVPTCFLFFQFYISNIFPFPTVAVVLTLGKDRWKRLRTTFSKLSGDMQVCLTLLSCHSPMLTLVFFFFFLQWKVRRTLAFSLHEIANIIGTDQTEEDLVPVFDLYLRDMDDVKIGVLTHFSKFLSSLKPATRSTFLARIKDLLAPTNNWRFRQLIAG